MEIKNLLIIVLFLIVVSRQLLCKIRPHQFVFNSKDDESLVEDIFKDFDECTNCENEEKLEIQSKNYRVAMMRQENSLTPTPHNIVLSPSSYKFSATIDTLLQGLPSRCNDTYLEKRTLSQMNYDNILRELGEFGPWQRITFLLLFLPMMLHGIQLTLGGYTGCSILSFTMVIEVVGVRERVPFLPWVSYNTLLGNLLSGFAMGLGEMVVPVVAIWARNWRQLQWIIAAGSFLFLVCILLPESPRWLIAEGRYKRAEELILAAAKKNGSKISMHNLMPISSVSSSVPMGSSNNKNEFDSNKIDKHIPSYSLKDIFHPCMRRSTLTMLFCWPATVLAYIGLIRLSSDLSQDTTTNTILSALAEVPSCILVILLLDIWGRKPLFSLSLIISGISCLIAAFMGKGSVLQIAFAITGKFFVSASFNIIYQYTAELYPTTIRNTAFGIFSMFARIGGIIAPLVVVYLPKVLPSLPWLALTLIGTLTTLGGLLVLLLPETLGFPLPETVQEVEKIKQNPKSFWTLVVPANNLQENSHVVQVEAPDSSERPGTSSTRTYEKNECILTGEEIWTTQEGKKALYGEKAQNRLRHTI